MEISAVTNQNFGKIFCTKKANKIVHEQLRNNKISADMRDFWQHMYKKADKSHEYDIYFNASGVAKVVDKRTGDVKSTHHAKNPIDSLANAIRIIVREPLW